MNVRHKVRYPLSILLMLYGFFDASFSNYKMSHLNVRAKITKISPANSEVPKPAPATAAPAR